MCYSSASLVPPLAVLVHRCLEEMSERGQMRLPVIEALQVEVHRRSAAVDDDEWRTKRRLGEEMIELQLLICERVVITYRRCVTNNFSFVSFAQLLQCFAVGQVAKQTVEHCQFGWRETETLREINCPAGNLVDSEGSLTKVMMQMKCSSPGNGLVSKRNKM